MVEMSVVLREQDRDHEKKCPRCGRVNVSSVIDRGWTEWEVPLNVYNGNYLMINEVNCSRYCAGFFQVSKAVGDTEIISSASYVLCIDGSVVTHDINCSTGFNARP